MRQASLIAPFAHGVFDALTLPDPRPEAMKTATVANLQQSQLFIRPQSH
jgi:hypothetical protein